MELYTDANSDDTIKVGYNDEEVAKKSIEKISKKSKHYKIKVIITLYNRVKFHIIEQVQGCKSHEKQYCFAL